MKLNRKSLVTVLSVVALVLVAGSAYLLRDRFFASTNTELGARSFDIKVVDSNNVGVKDAEVAIVFAPKDDTNAKTYFIEPTKAAAIKTQQFPTGLTADEITNIKVNPLSALTNSLYNSKITNPFDESQSFEDWGMAWYAHHTGGNAGCTVEPCFSNLTVIKFTNKEDKTTGADGVLQFKLSYLDRMMNKMVNNDWTAVRVYVHYNGMTTAQNLAEGSFAPSVFAKAKANDNSYTINVKLPDTSLATVADGDAGISVLIKDLKDQPVQGATVKLTLQCYKNGSEVYNSNTANADADAITLTSGADGIAKLTASGWESGIVKKLGLTNTNGCPKDKTAAEDNQPEGKLTKSLSVRAFYGEERTAPFVSHGPYPFIYNGSYADFFYVNTAADATGFADPQGIGDVKAAPAFTKVLTNTHPLTNGKIAYGDHATLEWEATNTSRCKIEGQILGATGSWTSPAVTANKDYSVTCYNGSLETTKTVSVVVGKNPSDVVDSGDGLSLTWFNNLDFQAGIPGTKAGTIQYSYAAGEKPTPSVNATNVTARFAGFIRPPASGDYTFYLKAADGVRLYIDGTNIIDQWVTVTGSPVEFTSTPVYLDRAYAHVITIDWLHNSGARSIELDWSSVGSSVNKELVQTKYLHTAEPVALTEGKCVINAASPATQQADGTMLIGIPESCENKSLIITSGQIYSDAIVLANGDTKRHFDNVTISNGAAVTYSGLTAAETNKTIASAAKKKIDWVLTGNLELNGGATINVNGKGYIGGLTMANTSDKTCHRSGESITPANGNGTGGGTAAMSTKAVPFPAYAGSGANAGKGGSYINGSTVDFAGGLPYQNAANASDTFDFGSGGGGAYSSTDRSGYYAACYAGGNGGGRVRIVAGGTITIAASSKITAKGMLSVLEGTYLGKGMLGASPAGGAGAGGTIVLSASGYNLQNAGGPSADAGTAANILYRGGNGETSGTMNTSLIATGGDSGAESVNVNATSGGGGVITLLQK